MTETNQEVGIDNAIIEMSYKTSPRAEDLIHISVGLAKKILIKHLPKSISREAVEKLREKRGNKDNEYADTSIIHFVKDLDQLLSFTNPQDGTK